MVESQGQTHCGVSAAVFSQLIGDGVNTQDTGLRRVDDGGEALDTEGTQIGYGEGCLCSITCGQLAFLGQCDEAFSSLDKVSRDISEEPTTAGTSRPLGVSTATPTLAFSNTRMVSPLR